MTALPQRQPPRWLRWPQWPISLLLPALLAAWALPLQAEPLQASDLAPLERIASEEIAAGHVPGAVILVGQGQHIVYRRAFGLRAMVPAEEAMTPDTVFDLASLTKVVVTTTAVLQLAERGRLDLDAPAATYWPAFTGQGKDSITLRQLLTHTSGLPPGLDLRGISGANAAAVWQRLLALKPRQPASQEPVYSDLNFIVLGEIVRRVAGLPLETYAKRRILAPLQMADAGFLPPASLLPRIAPTTWKGNNGNGGCSVSVLTFITRGRNRFPPSALRPLPAIPRAPRSSYFLMTAAQSWGSSSGGVTTAFPRGFASNWDAGWRAPVTGLNHTSRCPSAG